MKNKKNKKKQGFWIALLDALRGSFSSHTPKEWLKSLGLDTIFLVLFCVVLVLMVASGFNQLKSLELVAKDASSLVPAAYSAPSDRLRQEMADAKEGASREFFGLLLVLFGFLLLFFVLFCSWWYVGFSLALRKKVVLLRFVKFLALGSVWFLVCLFVLAGLVFLSSKSSLVFVVLLFLLFASYFSVAVLFSLIHESSFLSIWRGLSVSIRKAHYLVLPFLFCLLLFASLNLGFLFLRPSFSLFGGLLALLMFILLLSWSRIYLCASFGRYFS